MGIVDNSLLVVGKPQGILNKQVRPHLIHDYHINYLLNNIELNY